MSQRLLALSLLAAVTVTGAACSSKKPAGKTDDKATEPGTTAAVPAAAAKDDAAYERSAIGCDRVIAGVTDAAPKDAPVTVAPGWGKTPPELQLVPPGGELCGAMSQGGGIPLIRSSAYGPTLVDFYQPVAAKYGCVLDHKILGNDRYKRTEVIIKCNGENWIYITTDTGYEFYTVMVWGERKAS